MQAAGRKRLINLISFTLISGGLVIIILTFAPVVTDEINYQIKKTDFQNLSLLESPGKEEKVFFVSEKKTVVPLSLDFSLIIPKIGINAPVIANVDSGNEKEYLQALKKGVAHAQGSALPNQAGTVYIFAHSTNNFYNISHYNAVFFLLRKLEPGDQVFLYYKNKKYSYRVEEKEVINNEEISSRVKQIKGNALILQTCWPPGTTLKRLIVIARSLQ